MASVMASFWSIFKETRTVVWLHEFSKKIVPNVKGNYGLVKS